MPRTPGPSRSGGRSAVQIPYSTASTRSSIVLQTPTSTLSLEGSIKVSVMNSNDRDMVDHVPQEAKVKKHDISQPQSEGEGMSTSSTAYHPGIFVISKILARSLETVQGPDGESEHHYLVRWAGYGPSDDTWEPKSNLVESSASLVRAFDSRPLPFRILDITANHLLVRFGHEDSRHPPSPLAYTQWITEGRLRSSLGSPAPSNLNHLILAAREKHQRTRKMREDKIREKKRMKREEIEREKRLQSGTGKINRDVGPRMALLAILDRQSRKGAFSNPNVVRYLCEYTIGAERIEAWKEKRQLSHMFGSHVVNQMLAVWQKDHKASKAAVLNMRSEYEEERLRRIRENQDLIKDLGL